MKWSVVASAGVLAWAGAVAGAQTQEPVRSVRVGPSSELLVNGRPFLPIMLWLQDVQHFPAARSIGVNTIVGYGGKTDEMVGYARQVRQAGLYFVASYRADLAEPDGKELAGNDHLLGWIHGDEPDMPQQLSAAQVAPGEGTSGNPRTPFYRLVDGVTNTWTVLDPLEGASFRIQLKDPATVTSLAVWATVGGDLPAPKDVVFLADGKEILKAVMKNERGRQTFALGKPASFRELTVQVRSVYPGKNPWGSIGEVEGFDAAGKNVLLSPVWYEPRAGEKELAGALDRIQAMDPGRPVWMTFTSHFMASKRTRYDEATQKRVYPALARHADVVGFGTYPIFASAMFRDLQDVAAGAAELRGHVGPGKPIYAWIETNRGSRWIPPDKQPPVLPQHTRAETWMALIRGAAAVGYFTQSWVDPNGARNYTQFAPAADPAMLEELKRLNAQITKLTGPILGPAAEQKIEMKMADGLDCHFKATRHGQHVYVFAQNLDLGPNAEKLRQFQPISPRGGEATFTVQGLSAGAEIEVIDEGRTIKSTPGSRFTDEFGPLEEHIYRIPAEAFPIGGLKPPPPGAGAQ